jgi:ABC-type glycerol-3-phosphate transport system substrate-binding protein
MVGLFGCGGANQEVAADKPAENNTVEEVAEQASEEITLRLAWLGDGSNKESLEASFAKFTEETGTKVDVVFIVGAWEEYFTKIQTMIAGGEVIDNAYVAIEGFQMFKEFGLAQPVTAFVESNKDQVDKLFADVSKGVADSFIMDGEYYGFPVSFNNVVMHFNLELLEAAGLELPVADWGMDEFLLYCDALTKEVDGVKQYAVCIPEGNFMMEAWLRNNSTAFMTDDFSASLMNSPETVEIFQLWQDLVHVYGYAAIPEPNVDNAQQLVDGKIAMGSWGRWPLFTYENNEFREVGIQFLPSFKENKVQFGVDGLFIAADTEHYEEACELSLFAASEGFVRDYFTIGNIPARISLAEELVPIPGYPVNNEIFYNNNDAAVAVNSPTQFAETAAIVMEAYSKIVISGEDVQSTLDKAAEDMNSVLEK